MPFSVIIVGGGLVGSLCAVTLANKGFEVDVYELREDIRKTKQQSGRSINLALSVRGIEALREAGVHQSILDTLIPMKGRMIHSVSGQLVSQLYGAFGECINSVDRQLINDHLLHMAEKMPNVRIHFQHTNGIAIFATNGGGRVSKRTDLIIGADGAHSKASNRLIKEYIDHAWLELHIPPTADGRAQMDENHLHIWPRQKFMMIALPNTDHSFTVTLFMPFSMFESIETPEQLLRFFEATFPDSIDLIGRSTLPELFFKNPREQTVSFEASRCDNWRCSTCDGSVLRYFLCNKGQGMNCGFEDVSVLSAILDKHGVDTPDAVAAALSEYTATRHPDAHAICDLALNNYEEMRNSVTKTSYKLRKLVETALHRLFPKSIIPLYTMVSFTRIPYSTVVKRWQRQTFWLVNAARVATVGFVAGVFGLSFRFGLVGRFFNFVKPFFKI